MTTLTEKKQNQIDKYFEDKDTLQHDVIISEDKEISFVEMGWASSYNDHIVLQNETGRDQEYVETAIEYAIEKIEINNANG